MTQNIEQRTEVAVKKYEGSASTVDKIAHTDGDVDTAAGKRKSFPKISREWDDESQRLQTEWDDESQRMQKDWGGESQRLQTEWGNDSAVIREDWQTERNELSTKALGVKTWEEGKTEININQQRRWTDKHTYLPKSVPALMDAAGPDDNWIPYTADKADTLNDVFGRKPIDLIAGVVLVPDVRLQYPKLFAVGKMWELDDNDQPLTVKSFSATADEHLIITLDDDSQVIAHKMEGASREWAGKAFVGKKGAQKGQAVRPKPGNEAETEWYRPGLYDVSSFGDVGGDDENIVIADDAIKSTRDQMLAAGGGKMFMPATRYSVTSPIIPDQADTAGKFVIEGESQTSTEVETDQDIDVIVSRERLTMSRVKLKNTHANRIGRGVATNDVKQSANSIHRDAIIQGFRFGIFHRYSIWNEFRNLSLIGNTCNLRLSRHALQADNSNPEPSGGWNGWNNGWFHNVLTFDNVYAEGGEAGIWGCTMCGTYMGVTCQGQKTDGTNNDVLPEGMPGVGLFLDSGRDDSRNGWNNTVISYYSENTNIGIYAKNQRYTGVDGMFMQGGPSSKRASSAIVADNSLVMAKGVVGQDYFSDGVFRAINGGKLVLEGGFGGPMSGVLYSTDAASDILMRGQCDLDKNIHTVSKSFGVAEKTFTYPIRIPEYGTVKFYVLGIYDGYARRFGEMTVQRWNGSVAPEFHWSPKVSKDAETGKWDIIGAQPPGIDIAVSTSGVVTITLSGSQSLSSHIMMQIVGGHDISNKAQVLEGI